MILMTDKPNRKGLNFVTYESKVGIHNVVKLYDTVVVLLEENTLRLNTDGFKTNHTKNVMNDFINSLGMKVYQKDFTWYVDYNDKKYLFEDNMKFIIGDKVWKTK